MNKTCLLLMLFVGFISPKAKSCTEDSCIITVNDSSFANVEFASESFLTADSSLHKTKKHRRLLAAILSFPVPFGILGGHRLFFGTKPYMPFVYIGTLGGCFGILPLIDFIAILVSDNETFERYKSNPKVFMWTH